MFFDLDDTLCAYWDASKAGLRLTFEEHAIPGFTAEEMVRHWAASFREFSPTVKHKEWYQGYLESGEATRTEQMRLMLHRMGIEDEQLANTLSACYMEQRNRALRLFPDAQSVLRYLRERYALGLITNGPVDIQREEIDTLGIAHFFEVILIEGEMGEGKPNASVFARAAQAVRCEPSEILFVGNSYAHDVRPALANGWHAVWVRRVSDAPPSPDSEPAKPEEAPAEAPPADAVITDLGDLIRLLSPDR